MGIVRLLVTLVAGSLVACSSADSTGALDASLSDASSNVPDASGSDTSSAADTSTVDVCSPMCDGVCTDTMTDRLNCGQCSKACGPSETCALGKCTPCTGVVCVNQCVDTTKDKNNCGNCGVSCGAGSCCSSACTSTASDPMNCGSCGNACQSGVHSSTQCLGSACLLMCQVGWGDCDKDPKTGCEANLDTDANNCSVCGNLCKLPSAMAGCQNGMCFLAACNQGYADCDNNPQTGCEVNLNKDKGNCGACNKPCTNLQNCIAGNCQ